MKVRCRAVVLNHTTIHNKLATESKMTYMLIDDFINVVRYFGGRIDRVHIRLGHWF